MDDHSRFEQMIHELRVEKFKDKVVSSPLTKFENGRLIWLDLGCVGIESLPFGVFDGFRHLEYLGIYGNAIEEIPEKFFFNLNRLQYLDLGENQLKALPSELFDAKNSLKSLWIYSNEFEEISPSPFKNLIHLEELNLNSAIKGSIDWNLFRYLKKLRRLEIALNHLEDIPKKILPQSLETLIIERQLPSGGITIIDLFQEMKSEQVEKTDHDTFCLVTGLMGSGKSTIMKQLPYPKLDGYPPETDSKLFFDNLFALKRPDGYNAIFFELDGPTVLSWDQFIGISDVVVQVIRYGDLINNLDEVRTLAEHILSHKSESGKFILAVTYSPEDLESKQLGIPVEISGKIDAIFRIPPGTILPDVGGNRRVLIQKEALVNLCEEIFKVKQKH